MNFKKRKKIVPTEKGTGEVFLKGQDLTINPTPKQMLKRKKGRLHRIRVSLDGTHLSPEKRAYFEKVERMLELQIKLEEGDF